MQQLLLIEAVFHYSSCSISSGDDGVYEVNSIEVIVVNDINNSNCIKSSISTLTFDVHIWQQPCYSHTYHYIS